MRTAERASGGRRLQPPRAEIASKRDPPDPNDRTLADRSCQRRRRFGWSDSWFVGGLCGSRRLGRGGGRRLGASRLRGAGLGGLAARCIGVVIGRIAVVGRVVRYVWHLQV